MTSSHRVPPPPRTLRWCDRALAVTLLAAYLIWLTRRDLPGSLPGGATMLLAALGLLTVGLSVARARLTGAVARWWASRWHYLPGLLLTLILLAAFLVRLLPLSPTAPTVADRAAERDAIGEVQRTLTTNALRPRDLSQSALLLYLQTGVGAVAFLLGVASDRWRSVGEVRPDDLLGSARLLNALLSILTVALVYATGSALGGRRAGFWAAGLLALSPLAWYGARLATADTLAGLVLTLACWSVLAANGGQHEGRRGVIVAFLAALLVGLAIGVRPSFWPLLAPLLLVFWRMRADAARRIVWGVAPLALLLGWLLATPYALASVPGLLDTVATALGRYELDRGWSIVSAVARHIPEVLKLLFMADPLLTLAGGAGGLLVLWRRRRAEWLLVAFLLPAALILLVRRTPDLCSLAPYAPLLALLGGLALAYGWSLLQPPRRRSPGRTRRPSFTAP